MGRVSKRVDNPLVSPLLGVTMGVVGDGSIGPLDLPANVATQKIAVLGISGSGKTYAAMKTVELVDQFGHQVVVIDTVGNWWGLRLAADGKSPGIQIPILGGDHGDVPIDEGHGRLVAETAAQSRASMIVDISDFTGGEVRKFVVEFATAFLAAKKRHPSPVMVVWEECQDIVPQKVFGEDARMVGAVQKLIKKGRNYGVGTMLISQRPAAVNKEAIYQCHTLFAFRVIGKLDRKAIEDWTTDHGIEQTSVAMSKLPTGSCLLYSPEWIKRTDVVEIAAKRTFDASATPDFVADGKRVATLSPVDLEKFKSTMADAIAKADDQDPVRLAGKIDELERQIAAMDTGAMKPADAALLAATEERNEQLDRDLERLLNLFADVAGNVRTALGVLGDAEQGMETVRINADALTRPVDTSTARERMQKEIDRAVQRQPVVGGGGGSGHSIYKLGMAKETNVTGIDLNKKITFGRGHGDPSMSKLMRNLLTVLAQNADAFPDGMSKGKLLAYANYAPSGAVSTTFAEMGTRGLVAFNGKMSITSEGKRALGAYTPLPVGNAFYETVSGALDQLPRKLLKVIHDAYPNEIRKGKVLELANYAASGAVSTAFAMLVARDYIVKLGGGAVRASDHLFDQHKRRRV